MYGVWSYTFWAVRRSDGKLLSDVNGPVMFFTRREARDEAKLVCGVPIRVSVDVKEQR